MSELQKKIQRIQRREGSGAFGFGAARREAPRALLLAALARDKGGLKAAQDAGADIVIVAAGDANTAASVIAGSKGSCAGAFVASLDEAGAKALHDAGCDFVISTLDGTDSAAVDTDSMGQVVVASRELTDTTLRALGPMGLDALYVEASSGAMTLAGQLELVRLASFASCPLLVGVSAGASAAELRVLRDSGVAAVVAPAAATAEDLAALDEALKSVPASKRGRRDGREMAIVPAAASRSGSDDDDDDDE